MLFFIPMRFCVAVLFPTTKPLLSIGLILGVLLPFGILASPVCFCSLNSCVVFLAPKN